MATTGYAILDGNSQLSSALKKVSLLAVDNRLSGPGGDAPSLVVLTNVVAHKYIVADAQYFVIQVPSDFEAGSPVEIQIAMFSSNTAAARYVKWQMDWNSVAFGEVVTAGASGTAETGDVVLPTVANELKSVTVGTIAGGNVVAGDHLMVKLSRVAAVGTAPTAPADRPLVLHADIKYNSAVRGGATI